MTTSSGRWRNRRPTTTAAPVLGAEVSTRQSASGGGRPMRIAMLALSIVAASTFAGAASAQVPPAIAAPGESAVVTLHAEGAQVYECKAGSDGKLAWAFREPIATLLLDGKT